MHCPRRGARIFASCLLLAGASLCGCGGGDCPTGGLDPIYGYVLDLGGADRITDWALTSDDWSSVFDAQGALLHLVAKGPRQRRAAADGYVRIAAKIAGGWPGLKFPPHSRPFPRAHMMRLAYERVAGLAAVCPEIAEFRDILLRLRPPNSDAELYPIWLDVAKSAPSAPLTSGAPRALFGATPKE